MKQIGRLESEEFKPEKWVSNYYNPAFANMLPDDGFWAAKQVMTFTEPEIRAMVKTADYSSEPGVEYLIDSLVQRRDKIGRYYFSAVLPIDNVAIVNGKLKFDDLAVKYGFHSPRTYQYTWATFNNETGARTPIAGAVSEALPADVRDGYSVVQIKGDDPAKSVDLYIRHRGNGPVIVGIERHW